uniref:Late endosomal/lysosomal adaptor and MAPK and MTOR activator 5 n=1 Tax=Anopheles dirus TaxID=7168 RepID=A0A182NSP6_9DIPT
MEQQVDSVLDKITLSNIALVALLVNKTFSMDVPGNVGCLLANNQGLCLGASGNASEHSAGIIVAISDLASKLDPTGSSPVISMETNDMICMIHKQGVTGAIYKQKGV